MASRPSTAASAVVMKAANSSGIRSTLLRAASRIASNASKLAANVADRIVADVAELGWPEDAVLGSEAELLDRAFDWARRICVNAPLAVQATKESVLRGLSGTLTDAYLIEGELSTAVFATDDAAEGPKAFAEKRPPEWKGT